MLTVIIFLESANLTFEDATEIKEAKETCVGDGSARPELDVIETIKATDGPGGQRNVY